MAHPGLPRLDRERGFTMHFSLAVDREEHVRDDRAGLSLVIVCTDLMAVELSFWDDRVWIQDDAAPLFEGSRGEGVRRTGSRLTDYDLWIAGSHYELLADGKPVLSGRLRDYSAFGRYPYDRPNFLFIGDNTGSAAAASRLTRMSVALDPQPRPGGAADGYVPSSRWPATPQGRPANPARSVLEKGNGFEP
jgi:hypothetical protein